MKKIILAAVAAFFTCGAMAEDIVLVGAGSSMNSCGDWLSSRRSNDARAAVFMVTWLQGELSGMNLALGPDKMISLPSSSVIEATADKECADQPTTPIAMVGAKLYWRVYSMSGKKR